MSGHAKRWQDSLFLASIILCVLDITFYLVWRHVAQIEDEGARNLDACGGLLGGSILAGFFCGILSFALSFFGKGWKRWLLVIATAVGCYYWGRWLMGAISEC
jgi:hypothetical protein